MWNVRTPEEGFFTFFVYVMSKSNDYIRRFID